MIITSSITDKITAQNSKFNKDFKDYWYAGSAEITSYQLQQARYGEVHEGKAVLIFVTEDFLPKVQVKTDRYSSKNVSVLKLNATKYFLTGIYPYTIMQSVFFPVSNEHNAIKISTSIQEWCGNTYLQLNNREDFEITLHSYFEWEADAKFNLKKTWTENELWTKLRIDPKSLPIGNIEIIPSLEYTRLKHIPVKAYAANATMNKGSYILKYTNIDRSLKINFNSNFPYDILSWEETIKSGFGRKTKLLTTKATKIKTIQTKYWTKNSKADTHLRNNLGLK